MRKPISLEMFFQRALKTGVKAFKKKQYDVVLPMIWILGYPDNTTEAAITPIDTDSVEEADNIKQGISVFMRQRMLEKGATRYAIITECWSVLKPTEADSEWIEEHGTIQHLPDRIEQINVMAFDRFNMIMGWHNIIRHPNRKPYLDKLEYHSHKIDSDTYAMGRFANLLPQLTSH